MNIYVWRGRGVLQGYGGGLVVVAGTSVEDALEKLKREDFRAWAWLQIGISWLDNESELLRLEPDDYPEDYVPPAAEEYTPETLPALVLRGSD